MACIEGEPEVATSSVHSGTYTHEVEGLLTEVTENEAQNKFFETYDIVTTVELEGGLAKMCNLSEYIEEKGIEQMRA